MGPKKLSQIIKLLHGCPKYVHYFSLKIIEVSWPLLIWVDLMMQLSCSLWPFLKKKKVVEKHFVNEKCTLLIIATTTILLRKKYKNDPFSLLS